MSNSDYEVIPLDTRPDLITASLEVANAAWPEFMLHDPIANSHFVGLYETFLAFQFVLIDRATATVVATGSSAPLAWDKPLAALPESGWDWALAQAFQDRHEQRPPSLLCGLSIAVDRRCRGRGISALMVAAMRSIARAHGFSSLVAPVRPSLKHRYPLVGITRYARWKDRAGAPFDPWMRVHARQGASVLRPCFQSMRISGTIAEWERWTKMSFPESGLYVVPEALVPIKVVREQNIAQYIEPNVWMHHALGSPSS